MRTAPQESVIPEAAAMPGAPDATRAVPVSFDLLVQAALGGSNERDDTLAKTQAVLIPVQLLELAGLSRGLETSRPAQEWSDFDEPTDSTRVAMIPMELIRDSGFGITAGEPAAHDGAHPRPASVAPVPAADDDLPVTRRVASIASLADALDMSDTGDGAPRVPTYAGEDVDLSDLAAGSADRGPSDVGTAAGAAGGGKAPSPKTDRDGFYTHTTNSFRLDQLLADGGTDALVVGDPTQVTGQIRCEVAVPGGGMVVRDVMLGADVAALALPGAVLERTTREAGGAGLSPFEAVTLRFIDGTRTNGAIRDAMRVSDEDLRLVLGLLADKGLITVRRAAAAQPSAPGSSPTPLAPAGPRPPVPPPPTAAAAPTPPAAPPATSSVAIAPAAPLTSRPRGLVVANAKSQASILYEDAIRTIKRGDTAGAKALIERALELDPTDARYRDALTQWPAFVSAHETPPDQRAFAQAVRAEALGDLERAIELLRQATTSNPRNGNAWNRLGLLLARKKELRAALDALSRAVELSPNDASVLSNFAKVADAQERAEGSDSKLRALWRRLTG